MAGYRQWKLMNDCGIDNSDINNQTYRYNKILQLTKQVMTDNKNVTIMMDDNIDTLNDYTTIDRCRNLKLKEMRDNFLIDNSLTCLNDQPTFFRRGMKSCIDHVYTNTPQYTSNVTTHNLNILSGINSLSDHSILSFTYKQDD